MLKGFSKLNRKERIAALEGFLEMDLAPRLDRYLFSNDGDQNTFSELSENYLSNFVLPLGVVPNVLINGKIYAVPVVVEESSVVAAASKAASFWAQHGGFQARWVGTTKKGQIHFIWKGNTDLLKSNFDRIKQQMFHDTALLSEKMKNRGGGIVDICFVDKTHLIEGYFQIDASFETVDAMGANFINSCLEQMAGTLKQFAIEHLHPDSLDVIMAILSNYTPECTVTCSVSCNIDSLSVYSGAYSPLEFAKRFALAVQMAKVDINRAVTHNKGIYNGIDGVVLATGNDWRAVESAGHAFASRNGSYASLSDVSIENGLFQLSVSVPLAIGTIGGLTQAHPLSRLALEVFGNPSAKDLMAIAVAVGLANNFAAVSSLVTTGIQKGHMKLHLGNILNQLHASEKQKAEALDFFRDQTVSYRAVEYFLEKNTRK
jgi:hydroxymethylglutaryl-CoA reductase